MEDSIIKTSFDKESILMSIDNALVTIAEEVEVLNSFNIADYNNDKAGNLQLAITEYDTSLQAMRAAIEEGDIINMQAALQTLQNAISSLQAASVSM